MIVLDCEIKNAILGRGEVAIPGIEYCGGWRDFAGMGISTVCTYDTATHLSRCFLKEDLGDLSVYLWKKPTSGFNTKRFDNLLLAQHGVDIDTSIHYDMLEQIWIALGLNPDKFNPHTHGGWGLDAVCGATLGLHKTGHGALAPVWWQQKRHGKVIDYCLNDVHMEGQLLLHIIKYGWVVSPKDRTPLRVATPQHVLGASWCEQLAQGLSAVQPADFKPAYEEVPVPEAVAAQMTPGGLGILR